MKKESKECSSLSALNDCGEPEIPANGEVSIKSQTNYQEAEYNCRYGYELKGERVRTCYGRVWSGDQPTCNLLRCKLFFYFFV